MKLDELAKKLDEEQSARSRYAIMLEYWPKLIAVAEAARSFLAFHTWDAMSQREEPYIEDSDGGRLTSALAALEAE